MFSTTQLSFIENKIHQMFSQGYQYYLIHTNSNFDTYNRDHRDIIMYFSKEKFNFSDDFNFTTNTSIILIL